ncbi:MAG: hypothetical protein SGJ18_09230 [Pseudomonadota bacterium]|nr:hypothetical protein [Pseudomonadota bacterium]
MTQLLDLQSVPFALYADTLQGRGPANFVQTSAQTTQVKIDALAIDAAYTELMALINGTTAQYTKVNGSNFVPSAAVDFNNQRLTNLAAPTLASDAVNKTYSDAKFGGSNLDLTGLANGQSVRWNSVGTKWEVYTPSSLDSTKLPLAGGTMTGAIDMGGFNFLATGHITMSPQKTINLGTYTNAQETTLASALAAIDEGKTWFNSDSNQIKFWTGAAVAVSGNGVVGSAGTEVTSNANIPNCLANQKLQMSAGPVYAFTCVVDDAGQWVTSGANIYFNTGNVGIGTTAPTSRLDLQQTNTSTSGANTLEKITLTVAPSGTSTASNQGLSVGVYETQATAGYAYGSMAGIGASAEYSGAATSSVSTVLGGGFDTYAQGGTIGTVIAGDFFAMVQGSPATSVTNVYGAKFFTEVDGPVTATNIYGIRADVNSSGSVPATARYGVYVRDDNYSTATTTASYGVYIDSNANANTTNRYGIYQNQANDKNYFAGNVGIGTTTPTTGTRLDITGTGAAASSIIIPRDSVANRPAVGVNGMMRYASDTNKFEVFEGGAWTNMLGGTSSSVSAGNGTAGAPSISFSGDTNTGFYSNGADTVGIAAGGANVFNISSSSLSSPTTGGALITTGNGTAAAPTFSFAGDPDTGWWRPAADTMAASTAGAERMRIDSSGNVGIGTTSPLSALNLNKGGTANQDILIVGNNTTRGLVLDNATGGRLDIYTYGYDLVHNYYGGRNSVFHGRVNIGDIGDLGTANAQLQVEPRAVGTVGQIIKAFAGQTADLFQVQNSAGTNLVNVSAGGNVGIGTTSPTQKFYVSGGKTVIDSTDFVWGQLQIANASAASQKEASIAFISGMTAVGATPTAAGGDSRIFIIGNDLFDMGDNKFGIGSKNNSAASLVVQSDGNVGIGTTSPSQVLHVSRNNLAARIMVEGAGTSNGSSGVAIKTQDGGQWDIWMDDDSNDDLVEGDRLAFSYGTSHRMVLDGSSGNVGIGTTAPNTILDVNGAFSMREIAAPAVSPAEQGRIYFDSTSHNFRVSENGGAYVNLIGGTSSLDALSDGKTTPGTSVLFLGSAAGAGNLAGGNENTGIGVTALENNTTGDQNTAVGTGALKSNTTGQGNTAMGLVTLNLLNNGSYNTAFGMWALGDTTTGSYNTAVGMGAGDGPGTGTVKSQNVFIGYNAGFGSNTADGNIIIGSSAGDNLSSGDNNILIGYNMDVQNPAGSNQMSIGNLIFATGVDGTGTTVSTGKVGIGTTAPASKLHVGAGTISANAWQPELLISDSTDGYSGLVVKYEAGGDEGFMYAFGGGVVMGSLGASDVTFNTNDIARMTIKQGTGNIGIGTASPVATLDINGYARLALNGAQPVACDAAHTGSIALTSTFRICVCKGSATTWVYTTDGATACVW